MTYIGMLLGALLGWFIAWRKNGAVLDMLFYAAVFAIICGLIAVVINVIILRTI